MKKKIALKKFFDKRKVAVLSVGALLVVTSLYIWWSASYWNSYEAQQATSRQQLSKRIESFTKLRADTKEQRGEKFIALKNSVEFLSTQLSLCQVNGLIGWQRVFREPQKRQSTCEGLQAQLASLHNKLSVIVQYIEYEHRLAEILSRAPSGGEVSEGDFQKKLEGWRSLSKVINDMSSSGEFNTIKQAAYEKSVAIGNSWQGVVDAHQAKDKPRYEKAVANLAASYDTLYEIAKLDEDKLRMLMTPLDEMIKEI